MMTPKEKDTLYIIISSAIGEDPTVKLYVRHFNEQTVEVVEEMIASNRACNANMRKLVSDLAGGSSTLAKGWLRRLLKTSHKTIQRSDLNGYACSIATRSRWRTEIINSTI